MVTRPPFSLILSGRGRGATGGVPWRDFAEAGHGEGAPADTGRASPEGPSGEPPASRKTSEVGCAGYVRVPRFLGGYGYSFPGKGALFFPQGRRKVNDARCNDPPVAVENSGSLLVGGAAKIRSPHPSICRMESSGACSRQRRPQMPEVSTGSESNCPMLGNS